MPPSRGDTHSRNNGFVRGCFRARSLLLSSATPESEPPHFLLDYFFWASALDLLGACGYVTADLMRGYFNSHPDELNALYQILGVAFVIESFCFALSWRQVTYRVGCWPHMSAEYLNILACFMYLTTACLYGYRGGVQDSQTVMIGNAVVSIELAAAIIFTIDASLYWWTWCVDNLEAEEEAAGLKASDEGRVCARHAWLCFRGSSCRNVEMQEHVWNVIPSVIYITAALVSVYLQAFTANPPTVVPLPLFNDSIAVPGGECYPNVPYAAAGPPCANPRLFNAPCPFPVSGGGGGGVAICWEELSYAQGSLCGNNATDAWCVAAAWWTPRPRNASLTLPVANGTARECFRRGSYAPGDACAAPDLWPGLALPPTTCQFIDSLGPQTRPPCNDPGLWRRAENRTYDVIPRPPPPSIGELDALRYSARVYVIGDSLFAIDAAIVLWAWWIYAEDRRREYREHMLRGHGGGSGSAGSSSASLAGLDKADGGAEAAAEAGEATPLRAGESPSGESVGGGSDDDAQSVFSARSGVRRGRWAALGFAPTGLAKPAGPSPGSSGSGGGSGARGAAAVPMEGPGSPEGGGAAQRFVAHFSPLSTGAAHGASRAPAAAERTPLLAALSRGGGGRATPSSPLTRGAARAAADDRPALPTEISLADMSASAGTAAAARGGPGV